MESLNQVAHIIQLSVAPVFLLAGIAGLLNVMAGRLSRIVDRARVVEQSLPRLNEENEQVARRELAVLWRRVLISNWSIGLCTFAALMVCILVTTLFVGSFIIYDFSNLIVAFFILSLLLLTGSLCLFMVEIQMATRTLRADGEFREGESVEQ